MNKTPTTLIIMDGFGLRTETEGNAVAAANTPRLDQFFQEDAHTELSASGLDVGLPAGQMGNSEVGHTNIGAGRVVFQDLPRISKSIDDGDFFQNPAYVHAMDACKEKRSALALNSAMMYSVTSKIFVRGSSLWALEFPGKYWPKVMSFSIPLPPSAGQGADAPAPPPYKQPGRCPRPDASIP